MRWLRASRRRARFPRSRARQSGPAVSGRGRARRRSGDDARRRDAGAGHAVRIPVRRPAARRAHRDRRSASAHDLQVPAHGRDRAGRAYPSGPRQRRTRAGRPVRRPHRLLQRAGLVPGVHDRAHHDAPRSDLPLDLHRQAARRAGGARRGAERSVRAAAAKAVSRDHRLLPAARRLQLPDGGRAA